MSPIPKGTQLVPWHLQVIFRIKRNAYIHGLWFVICFGSILGNFSHTLHRYPMLNGTKSMIHRFPKTPVLFDPHKMMWYLMWLGASDFTLNNASLRHWGMPFWWLQNLQRRDDVIKRKKNFRGTGPLCDHWWIPLTKASDAQLWRFIWSAPEQTVE